MTMTYCFIKAKGIDDEDIILNISEISSIVSEANESESTVYMKNGNEFGIKESAKALLMRIGK